MKGVFMMNDIDKGRKQIAFEELEQLRKYIPDFDEKRELDEWREEKFGNVCNEEIVQ